MTGVTESARAVTKAAAAAFGGKPSVARYYDVPETHFVAVLRCDDAPQPGLVTYSTVTLHEASNLVDGQDIRVELAGVAPVGATAFPNALTWVALTVLKDHWTAAPGEVFPNVLQREEISIRLAHLMLVEPFDWETLAELRLPDGGTVHWLHALPISESEYLFMLKFGFEDLNDKLVAAGIEYPNLERPSVV